MRIPLDTFLILVVTAVMFVSCPVIKEGTTYADEPQVDLVGYSPDESVALETMDSSEDAGGVEPGEHDLREQERHSLLVSLESDPLSSFFEQLRQLELTGEGLVRILHYGDSHTAADFLTTEIRRSLQGQFGDGGRGFILLGKPWRSYRPKDVKVSATGKWKSERILVAADPATLDGIYGLAGISATTEQAKASCMMKTSKATKFGRSVSVFEIFYLAQPEGGTFKVYIDGKIKGTVSTAAKHKRSGFFRLEAPNGSHRLELKIVGDGEVRLFGGVMESDGPGIVYDTLGLNGGFFYTPLRWDAEILAEQINRRNPGLIVTMYGANETDSRNLTPKSYKRKVIEVMSRFRAGAPEAACLMLGPTDRKGSRKLEDGTSQLDWIINVQNEVADEIGCAFLNTRELMGGPKSQKRWANMSPAWGQKDGIHLTVDGYRELAGRISKKIINAYDVYKAAAIGSRPNSEHATQGNN